MTEYPKCPDCGGEIVIHELTDEYSHVRLVDTEEGVIHELAGTIESFPRPEKTEWECFRCEKVFSKEEVDKIMEDRQTFENVGWEYSIL